jgi:GNAT superfamily N-acetyltransferase
VDVTIEPATPDRWDDVVTVFGTRGDPSRCWCSYLFRDRVDYSDRAGNRQQLRERVASGSAPGVLAYAAGEPVGWAAVTPREEMLGRLTRSPSLEVVPGEGVWSVECFVVPVPHRRKGVATALLAGAVAHARSRGGRAVEGHPREDRDGHRWPGAVAYPGLASMFAAAGFTEVARRGDRPVFRLDL